MVNNFTWFYRHTCIDNYYLTLHFIVADMQENTFSGEKYAGTLRTISYWDKYSGPSCSKLMTLLVNDSLKFTSSYMQICCNFLLKKCKSYPAFAVQKLHTFFQQKISEYCVLNLLKQLKK